MNRYLAASIGPAIDVLLFDALIGAGVSLQRSHIAAFGVAIALNYILKLRATLGAERRSARFGGRLLAASFMALFLRGGVLALLTKVCGWPAQLSIVFAVAAGLAVTLPGFAYVLRPNDAAPEGRRLTMILIAYAFALRLVYSGSVELLPEEAYYWNYARHLDIGYLDHPPMVAWLITLGTAVCGPSEFGVRIGAALCGAVTSFFAYLLTRNLCGEAVALRAVLLTQTLPFFFLSGLLMTPDAPLTAAWAATLYFLERALLAQRSRAWGCAGLTIGLGLVSKYSIGLLAAVALAFMVWDEGSRRWWRRWEPYAAGLLAVAVFAPVIIWNAQHEWASFAFQTSRRLAEPAKFALHKLLASTLVLMTPTGVLAIAVGMTRSQGGSRSWTFIKAAVLLPLAVFALFSLRHEVKLDWTGAPWTAAIPVMAAGMLASGDTLARGVRAFLRAAWTPTIVTLLLIYGGGLHYLALGLPGVGYGKHIELLPVGWSELSRQITGVTAEIRAQGGNEPLIVGMDRYAIASELSYYGALRTKSVVRTSSSHLFGGIGLMYELWTPARLQEGRNLLLVAWNPGDLSEKYLESHVEKLGPIEQRPLTQDGKVIRQIYYRLAYHYLPLPRERPAQTTRSQQ